MIQLRHYKIAIFVVISLKIVKEVNWKKVFVKLGFKIWIKVIIIINKL